MHSSMIFGGVFVHGLVLYVHGLCDVCVHDFVTAAGFGVFGDDPFGGKQVRFRRVLSIIWG